VPPPPWLRETEGAIDLDLLVQPRASRTRVVGVHDGRLKVQLAAPPVDGEANLALVDFLAGALGVKKSTIEIRLGETGRRKTVRVHGASARAVLALVGPATG
jgi:uncharacterized protein